MNNLKKLGLTALAGSLVAVSAQAGELSVSGSANMTYKTNSGSLGKGIGQNSAWSMSGSGELDNGWTIAHGIALTDAQTLSSSNTKLTMGSMGSVTVGQGHGAIAASYDEEVPQAYEQVSDIGTNTAANYLGSWMDNGAIQWAAPSIDAGGGSLAVSIGYAPNADDSQTTDGSVGTHGTYGTGWEVGATLTTDMGLTLGVYGAERNLTKTSTASSADSGRDQFDGTFFVKYSNGPVSVGYQQSYVDAGMPSSTVTAATSAKTIGTSTGIYEDTQYSISFNVNDNLSISYTDSDSTYDDQSDVANNTQIADATQSQDAIQVAYSMGGLSISAYQMSVQNPGHDTNATEITATEIAVGLAF
jgi:outer membrane protein OmpU